MKPLPTYSRLARRLTQSAFTMVEIAFSLAIIGIALISIIGVLPIGLEVQKNNRRETIINQDANYFVEAIRGGGRGLDDLTNYVTSINNYWTRYTAAGVSNSGGVDSYTNPPLTVLSRPASGFSVTSISPVSPVINDVRLTNGVNIIGVLSTPKYVPVLSGPAAGGFTSNYIVAIVQAISGAASEKYPQNNGNVRDLAFSYRMVVELNAFHAGTNSSSLGFFDPAWTNYLAVDGGAAPGTVNANINQWIHDLTNYTSGAVTTNGYPVLTNYVGPVLAANADFMQRLNYWLLSRQTTPNLYDLRLLFRFPVLPGGRLGNGRQTYRAMLSGAVVNLSPPNSNMLYVVSSQNYTNNYSLP